MGLGALWMEFLFELLEWWTINFAERKKVARNSGRRNMAQKHSYQLKIFSWSEASCSVLLEIQKNYGLYFYKQILKPTRTIKQWQSYFFG